MLWGRHTLHYGHPALVREISNTSDNLLEHFIAMMLVTPKSNGDSYKYGTIKTYLSAVRDFHIEHAGFDPTDRARVRRCLHAARKYCVRRGRAKRKWPISPAMLRAWRKTLKHTWDDYVRWGAALLAFFGLHRVSEYAWTGKKYKGLRRGNVEFSDERDDDGVPKFVVVHLERHKNDLWRFGTTYKYFRSGTDLCLVDALWAILQHDKRPRTEPLFVLSHGKKLSRTIVEKYAKCMARLAGLPVGEFNTHSFRAGGACALWAAGYSARDIQILGRWRSDCWRIYVTQSDERIKGVTRRMSQASPSGVEYAQLHGRLQVEPLRPTGMRDLARIVGA
jgi:hypothetical protein